MESPLRLLARRVCCCCCAGVECEPSSSVLSVWFSNGIAAQQSDVFTGLERIGGTKRTTTVDTPHWLRFSHGRVNLFNNIYSSSRLYFIFNPSFSLSIHQWTNWRWFARKPTAFERIDERTNCCRRRSSHQPWPDNLTILDSQYTRVQRVRTVEVTKTGILPINNDGQLEEVGNRIMNKPSAMMNAQLEFENFARYSAV